MSKTDDAVGAALSTLTKCGVDAPDVDLLRSIISQMGPSAFSQDAQFVACSDAAEKKRVADGFLANKLGVEDGMASVETVCEQMKAAGSQKRRSAFYYLLTKHHGKESVYA